MNIRQKMIACGAISVIAAAQLGGIGFLGQTQLASSLAENELAVAVAVKSTRLVKPLAASAVFSSANAWTAVST